MPLYEYKCLNCEKVIEIMQKFSDAPLEACPDCGKEVTKLMSLSSFSLKGKGWYTTDYKRNGSQSNSGSDSGSETPPETKPEGKAETHTDSKTATKPENKTESKSEAKPEVKTPTKCDK